MRIEPERLEWAFDDKEWFPLFVYNGDIASALAAVFNFWNNPNITILVKESDGSISSWEIRTKRFVIAMRAES